jgi:hypothetical protein
LLFSQILGGKTNREIGMSEVLLVPSDDYLDSTLLGGKILQSIFKVRKIR